MVKTGGETVNVRAFDVLPAGFATVTVAAPREATSLAEIAAVNWDTLINVVVRFDPFHLTVEPEPKLLPLTVRVKAGLPAGTVLGLMLLSTGVATETTRLKALVAVWGVG